MNVSIFAEYPSRNYFEALYCLQEKGRIDRLQMFGIRDFIKKPIEILKSLQDDLRILGCAPYHEYIYFFYLTHLLNKNSIFYTSWPYWNVKNCVWGHNLQSVPFNIGYDLFIRKLLWEKYLKQRKVITVTKAAQKSLQDKGALAYHIPHSVDTKLFKPKDEKEGKIKILHVGRTTKEKGVLELIHAMEILAKEDVEFWFVGKGPLEEDIRKMGGEYPVKHFGYISDKTELAEIYAQADIFALPSRGFELFGIVLIEAMACGLPAIATNHVGPREIIENGVNGYIIPEKDENALAKKIKVLVENEELRKKMGKRGRKMAVEKYDIEKIAEKWWEVMNK